MSRPRKRSIRRAMNLKVSRRIVAVAIAGLCAFLNLYAPQPVLPLLSALFHVSAAQISATVSASTIGVAVSAPFAGMFADRFGRSRSS